MKQCSDSFNILRVARLKKHLKKSKSLLKRINKKKALKKEKKQKKKNPPVKQIIMEDALLSNELSVLSPKSLPRRYAMSGGTYKFKVPRCFDLFASPEEVLKAVAKFRAAALNPSVNEINIYHRNVLTNCLASEVLLGILAVEIRNFRKRLKQPLHYKGVLPNSRSRAARVLLVHTGLLRQLLDKENEDAKQITHNSDVHVYRAENRYDQTSSVTGDDKKTQVSEECVEHLEECLNQHLLTLSQETQFRLTACLGEILDNANEHCDRTSKVWYVRSYLNNNWKRHRYFELCVFNLGQTIAESFEALGDGSAIKQQALSYVEKHEHLPNLTRESLLTVAALQGNISSKRDDDETRGQGTVTLIETFESIYSAYCDLRVSSNDSSPKAQMSLISGSTVIDFDSTYSSKTTLHNDGSESFVISFNKSNTLKDAPDANYVRTMDEVKFPGVMINIRLPLQGNTLPLDEEG
ncbi:hypothetical protein EGL69_13620 [Vibrio parahaemolyticus]|uniref:hypothetical protein n=1 Tax=Vibrio parahaemolyticus TaxID=670 RepID=UPI00100E0AE8|nr:hypothetical protein [Vibrio parahaemolyticus]RXQ03306.1 hypothetical protein EGL69_13620 [Vibrio parahaemolyticus]